MCHMTKRVSVLDVIQDKVSGGEDITSLLKESFSLKEVLTKLDIEINNHSQMVLRNYLDSQNISKENLIEWYKKDCYPSKEFLIDLIDQYKTINKVSLYLKDNTNYECGMPLIARLCDVYNINYVKKIQHKMNHNFFAEDNEKSFYWAGFIAADGCIVKNSILFGIKSTDANHLEKFLSDIESDYKVKIISKIDERPNFPNYITARCCVTSIKMVEDLKRFGIGPAKSLTYEMPDLNPVYLNHFIRGIIDGDGSIGKYGIQFCGTKQSVIKIYDSLKKNLQLHSGSHHKSKMIYGFTFNVLSDQKKIIHYLYDNATIFLDRKKEKSNEILTRQYLMNSKYSK